MLSVRKSCNWYPFEGPGLFCKVISKQICKSAAGEWNWKKKAEKTQTTRLVNEADARGNGGCCTSESGTEVLKTRAQRALDTINKLLLTDFF